MSFGVAQLRGAGVQLEPHRALMQHPGQEMLSVGLYPADLPGSGALTESYLPLAPSLQRTGSCLCHGQG